MRNVVQKIFKTGLVDKAYVLDMSTGYFGNLGFSMPDEWAFDQFAEI
ncbi:hypothetical protein LB941_11515 [Ligilactobacillus sp. WILCCON 0076]|uniref:Uncharacterized protein n=1 Tax=Ligilactobacillus ubinensis TaxID=2876789 RepID=A0A9X2FLP3_9LACO|nr:hypothetical protein [Ligilactobacillus ubinensis]MCP0887959.1 hypothetical protein [Ligilactobacillus ubinensis]